MSIAELPEISPSSAHQLIDKLRRAASRWSATSCSIAPDRPRQPHVAEAPVPVVVYDSDEFRLGGAANVPKPSRARRRGSIDRRHRQRRVRGACAASWLPGIPFDGADHRSGAEDNDEVRVVTTRNQQVSRIDFGIRSRGQRGDRERDAIAGRNARPCGASDSRLGLSEGSSPALRRWRICCPFAHANGCRGRRSEGAATSITTAARR